MIYFWVIPVLLLLVLLLVLLFYDGTKRTSVGESRLDAALADERREGLRN